MDSTIRATEGRAMDEWRDYLTWVVLPALAIILAPFACVLLLAYGTN